MDSLTIQTATSPDAIQIRQLHKVMGRDFAIATLSKYLIEADAMCPGQNDANTIRLWAAQLLRMMEHRSVASIIMAIRDGLRGKVYGSLSFPTIAEWMNDHEAKVLAMSEAEHSQAVFKNDNWTGMDMDRVEMDANRDRRRAERLTRQVEQLKAKLSNTDSAR